MTKKYYVMSFAILLFIFLVPIAAADETSGYIEFNMTIQDIQNGHFKNYPHSKGYPNVKTAFNFFFDQPQWLSSPWLKFKGITKMNGKNVRIMIDFTIDDFKLLDKQTGKPYVRILGIHINNSPFYKQTLEEFPAKGKSLGLPNGNLIDVRDFLADIFDSCKKHNIKSPSKPQKN